VIPPVQHDSHAAAKLKTLLIEGAVEVHEASSAFSADGRTFPAGSALVLMAQPFRAYAKTLLEPQRYPVRRFTPGGPPERPYDVAGWTLPYQMGVEVATIDRPFELPALTRLEHARIEPLPVGGDPRPGHYVIDARGNGGSIAINRLLMAALRPAWRSDGSVIVPHSIAARKVVARIATELGLSVTGLRGRAPAGVTPIVRARVAIYKPWVDNIDEGWTRWLLEQYEFPHTNITDADVRRGSLRAQYDVIVLPDGNPERLRSGHPAGTVPEPYAGGLGSDGTSALRAFVEAGGTLVALDSAAALAIDALNLPVRDVAQGTQELFCPGSILSLDVDPVHPLAFGMRPRTAAFFAYSSVYELTAPSTTNGNARATEASIEIVGRYAARDVLMSGWLEGERLIAGRPAVLSARVGLGRAVLIGFRAQHRAQSHATFRLLFNAIHTSGR
jgi:hypothetical protein